MSVENLREQFRLLQDAHSAAYDLHGADAPETQAAWLSMKKAGRSLKSYYAKMGESLYGRGRIIGRPA